MGYKIRLMIMKHYEKTILIPSNPENIFNFTDNHANFSAHMNQASWMMGGGRMDISTDEGYGRQIGSHIHMTGKALGISIFLDEVVTDHRPPRIKTWETVGNLRLLVIGHYKMGFEIIPQAEHSSLRVFIDYDLPTANVWLGRLFGNFYARWCVAQMIKGVSDHFILINNKPQA